MVAVCLFGVLKRRRWTVAAAGVFLVLDAVAMAGLPQFSAPRSSGDRPSAPRLPPLASRPWPLRQLRRLPLRLRLVLRLGSDRHDCAAGTHRVGERDHPGAGLEQQPDRFDGQQVINPSGPSAAEEALSHLATYRRLPTSAISSSTTASPHSEQAALLGRTEGKLPGPNFTILAVPSPAPYYSTTRHGCHLAAEGFDSVVVTCTAPGHPRAKRARLLGLGRHRERPPGAGARRWHRARDRRPAAGRGPAASSCSATRHRRSTSHSPASLSRALICSASRSRPGCHAGGESAPHTHRLGPLQLLPLSLQRRGDHDLGLGGDSRAVS